MISKKSIITDTKKNFRIARSKHIITKRMRNIITSYLENGYSGKDLHVAGVITILRKYNIEFDEEMEKGILFHQGYWSKYHPIEMNQLAILIHITFF
jgi:hypothetical protein